MFLLRIEMAQKIGKMLDCVERQTLRLLTYMGAIMLMALMLLTCVDVFQRYVFDRPISGSFELTEILLATSIFIGLPLVSLRNEHVTIDLLDNLIPDWLVRTQYLLTNGLSGSCLAYLAWQLGVHADSLAAARETTTQLQIPLGWIVYGMSTLCGIASLAIFSLVGRTPDRSVHIDLPGP